jgi:putative membrane protein
MRFDGADMRNFLALMSCLLAILPPAAFASSNPDAAFFKSAAANGIAEIEAGRLAESKGSSQRVKDFGAMMVREHSAANETLQTLAKAKNVGLSFDSNVGRMAAKAMLEVLSGSLFDQSYIKNQISAHRQAIALLKKEIDSGLDADAKAFASAALPGLRSHLDAIKTLAAEMGIPTQ